MQQLALQPLSPAIPSRDYVENAKKSEAATAQANAAATSAALGTPAVAAVVAENQAQPEVLLQRLATTAPAPQGPSLTVPPHP